MGSTGAPPRKVRRCLKARPTTGPTIERHGHVTGGPDVAILYCLSLMLERGYDYVGLIENDLEPGWLDRIFQLFATPRLNVGSVSARSDADRVLLPRNGYAIMANVGAGMVLFKRAAAEAFSITPGPRAFGSTSSCRGISWICRVRPRMRRRTPMPTGN